MTTLVRWEPFREVAALHNELSRFMNGLGEGNGRDKQEWVPTLDVWETDDELVYEFDLPGIARDKIAVEVEDGALTVSATRERSTKVDASRFARFERRYGSFARTVGLPQGTTDADVRAAYADGVLEIRVKKAQQPKPTRIEIADTGVPAEPPTIEGTATRA